MNRDEGNKMELLKHKIIVNRVVHAKGTSRAKNPDTEWYLEEESVMKESFQVVTSVFF